jgi:hypothetical protein
MRSGGTTEMPTPNAAAMNRPWKAPVATPCREEQAVAGGQHRDQVGQDEQQERAGQDDPFVQPDRERGQ